MANRKRNPCNDGEYHFIEPAFYKNITEHIKGGYSPITNLKQWINNSFMEQMAREKEKKMFDDNPQLKKRETPKITVQTNGMMMRKDYYLAIVLGLIMGILLGGILV